MKTISMPIEDVMGTVVCDECGDAETRELPFRFPDLSGRNGFHSLKALVEDLEDEGWEISPETDEAALGANVTCPECAKEDDDDE